MKAVFTVDKPFMNLANDTCTYKLKSRSALTNNTTILVHFPMRRLAILK